jgi:alpha-glucosidase
MQMAELKWWQQAVFYQIYPRSFADGNGDGIGDFPGITSKLDYLQSLGIDALWLSPHYPSPFLDCGYDISDYSDVGPEYGTLDDFKIFLEEAHKRGIRVILDLVLNHSSHQHRWFIESRSSRDNPKRDWYVWRDGKADEPPNNWVSIFGGSAWEYDPTTEQYYYHAFLKEQPDLNWRNPEVKQAVWEAVRFWLDMGVDGFRLDAIATIYEHPDLPNHPLPIKTEDLANARDFTEEDYRRLMQYQKDQPGLHELMKELRTLVDEYPGDRVLVGEDDDFAYHGSGDDELHLVFNFPLMKVERLSPKHIYHNQVERLSTLPAGAWPCNTLGNHDVSRVKSHYGNGYHDSELARLHLALMLTLKGTPFLYNGEEIGMVDLTLQELDQIRDMAAISRYEVLTEKLKWSHREALAAVMTTTRDRCRTPLQWSAEPNAGFSPADVQTWLPVHPNYEHGINVATQENDLTSMLNFYRQMLRLRRETPALIAGDYTALEPHEDVFAFIRSTEAQTVLVVINFCDETRTLTPPRSLERVLFSNDQQDAVRSDGMIELAPFEVFIAEVG